ncbi:MAG: hypothetical protein AAF587_16050 [Bacteroidota bacterium]
MSEYWIVDPEQEQLEIYVLDREHMKYKETSLRSKKDHLLSQIVEGFRIPVLAIFDKKTNLATLKNILGS